MGFEKRANITIKEEFIEHFGFDCTPTLQWTNGCLYADTSNKEEVNLIKDTLEWYSGGYKVLVSCLKATDTEPWDQYAFDITDEPMEKGTWSEFSEEGLLA